MTTGAGEKLRFREMLSYGCGDFAAVLYWITAIRFLPYFYTEIYGLSAAALGNLMLFSRVWDGINDPLVGMWADRNRSRWGRYRPFILFGCVPFGVTAVLAFTTPQFGENGKLIWAYATYNAFMMLSTVVNIPYTSLLGVISANPAERTRLASVKFSFAYASGLGVSAALLHMAGVLGEGRSPQFGWQATLAIFGLVATGFYLIAFVGTRERVQPTAEERVSIWKDLKILAANKPWVVLLVTSLIWSVAQSLRTSICAHYFKYFVHNGSTEGTCTVFGREFSLDGVIAFFFTASGVAALAGMVAGGFVAARVGKKGYFIFSYGVGSACALAFYFVDPTRLELLIISEVVGSLLGSPAAMLAWAMFADTADYGEWHWNRRTTALIFSVSALCMKVGDAIGAKVSLEMLDRAGFVANQAPSEAVREVLRMLMSVYPVVVGAVSLGVFLLYPLSERRVKQIAADLAQRRAARNGGGGGS